MGNRRDKNARGTNSGSDSVTVEVEICFTWPLQAPEVFRLFSYKLGNERRKKREGELFNKRRTTVQM